MKVQWTVSALNDLREVQRFIAEDNPEAATHIVLTIMQAAEERLSRFPELGRKGRVEGTRELVVPGTPFILPYCVKDGALQVLRVYHANRKWPSGF